MTDAIIPKPIKILLVDKEPDAAASNLRASLNQATLAQFKLRQANRLNAALVMLMQEEFDLILLNLDLPDSQGLDSYLRICEHSPEVPVVVIADVEDRPLALDVIRAGAQDYALKSSLEADHLERTLLYAIERHRFRSMLQNLSLRDDLTGLLNRRGFLSLASQHLKIAQRSSWQVMLLFADLDDLKSINDSFGHPEGDEALRAVANILRQTFR
ncbi:MAG TPA: diguanylate cyclase, partial [Anaerolineales bacterium]